MSASLKDMLLDIPEDPWRREQPFSPEFEKAQGQILVDPSKESIREKLLEWLGHHQPCLFGRAAARANAIETCVILEDEIMADDDLHVRELIQHSRTRWDREGFHGRASGFIVLVVSNRLCLGQPSEPMLTFAQKLANLYLLREETETDEIYHDEIFLEVVGEETMTWKWLAGVNFFAAAADGRWWQDHRIPGGIAFSVNSVGHLVKAGILSRVEGLLPEMVGNPHVDSLPKALEWAMRTISMASETPSGRATFLEARSVDSPPPPISLPPALSTQEHRFYKGYYHTDSTLPTEYFRPDVTRPPLQPLQLDLGYLFDAGIHNPDFILMGEGRRIRADEPGNRYVRADGKKIAIASSYRLMRALGID